MFFISRAYSLLRMLENFAKSEELVQKNSRLIFIDAATKIRSAFSVLMKHASITSATATFNPGEPKSYTKQAIESVTRCETCTYATRRSMVLANADIITIYGLDSTLRAKSYKSNHGYVTSEWTNPEIGIKSGICRKFAESKGDSLLPPVKFVERERKQHRQRGSRLNTERLKMAVVGFLLLWLSYLVDFFQEIYYRGKRQFITSTTNPIVLTSATQLARNIRDGKLTSEEVVKAHIERIKEVNDVLNAVVDERFEEALEEARQLDRDIKNGAIKAEDFNAKPFLGVPFSSKESTHCKEMNITFGLLPRKSMKAKEDADVIKFMKNAGGILIGVTNVPQINLWWETHNPVYGTTNNPYDTTKCAGGSSGGEGSIIAACGSPIGVGTDIGGSLRIPAYMCGLFAHKPSPQLTSTKGMTFRDGSESDTTMVVVGPMARYAEDLIPGLKAMLGPAHKKLDLDQAVDISSLKYYYMDCIGDIHCPVIRPEIKDVMTKVVTRFKEITPNVESISIDAMKDGCKLFRYWLNQEKGTNFKYDITNKQYEASAFSELAKYLTGKSDLNFAAILVLLSNTVLPAVDADWANKTTENIKNDLLTKLDTNGVLFFHSMPAQAHYHHASYLRPFNMIYYAIFNVLKLPVTQVPLGLSAEGTPLGIQVVAAPGQDHLCIAVAKELEKSFGGYVPPFSK